MKYSSLVLISLLVFGNSFCPESKASSESEKQQSSLSQDVSSAWFAEFNRNIENQAEYCELISKLNTYMGENQNAVFWLKLNKIGKIVETKSDIKCPSLKKTFFMLIKKSMPKHRPFGQLNFPENILIRVQKTSDKLTLRSYPSDRRIGMPISIKEGLIRDD